MGLWRRWWSSPLRGPTDWCAVVKANALIFDFDGTMVDTEWPKFTSVRDVYAEYGLELTVHDWVSRIGRADHARWPDRLAQMLGHEPDPAIVAEARRRSDAETDANGALPGVLDLLAAAERRELPVAVASSSPLEWVNRHLARLQLMDRIAAVRSRDHVDRAKPWPDVFLAAADAVGCDPGAAVVIEDSSSGCAAAKAAGMTCVVVPNRITRVEVHSDADWVLESLEDFPYEHFGLHAAPG